MGAQAGLSSKLCFPPLQTVLNSAIDFFFYLFLPVFLELAKISPEQTSGLLFQRRWEKELDFTVGDGSCS